MSTITLAVSYILNHLSIAVWTVTKNNVCLLTQCTEKLMSAQKHSTVSRNDYMLCLAQTNSQLTKHFEVDLFEIIKVKEQYIASQLTLLHVYEAIYIICRR